MRRKPACVLVLALSAAVSALSAPPSEATTRAADPVVVTGARAGALVGADPARVVAFRRSGAAWQQVPVQVDERALVNLAKIYPPGVGATPASALIYTDPETFTGADPDPKLDADDEIALMWRDTGPQAPGVAPPPGVRPGSAVALALEDPLDGEKRWVYLYEATDPALDPSAGKHYVDYRFVLRSGDYRTTYGVAPGAGNPEDSTVTTASYSERLPDRWTEDELRLSAGGASAADLLDRHTAQFAPTDCSVNERTFATGGGAFIANKSGPVRAIRSYIGANSGPYTQRDHVFYDAREEIHTYVRVHSIGSIMDLLDYGPAAIGMTYRNSLNPGGVTVDGVPDSLKGGFAQWEQVSGAPGTLTSVFRVDRVPPGVTLTGFYLDQRAPPPSAVRLCTGDADALALSGPCFGGGIPNTAGPGAQEFADDRVLYADPPGGDAGLAQAHAKAVMEPIKPAGGPSPTPPPAPAGSATCGGSAGPPPPPPPPPPPNLPSVTPVDKRVRFDSRDRLRVVLRCTGSAKRCKGRIAATALVRGRKRKLELVYLGGADFRFARGKRAVELIQPSRSDKRAMGDRTRVRVRLKIGVSGSPAPPAQILLKVPRA